MKYNQSQALWLYTAQARTIGSHFFIVYIHGNSNISNTIIGSIKPIVGETFSKVKKNKVISRKMS